MTKPKKIIIALSSLLVVVCVIISVILLMPENVIEFSDNAVWYEYDADNILGIKATVVDGRNITYIFDKDKCLFDENTVKKAFAEAGIFGCSEHMVSRTDPLKVEYGSKSGEVYLIFYFGLDANMDKVGGFYFYFSEDEWITAGHFTGTIFINHYVVHDRGVQNQGSDYSWDYAQGDNFFQIWDKDDANAWSEVKNKGYYWNNMPLE